jgi:WhiB family redox-sensing transcriptional regulator
MMPDSSWQTRAACLDTDPELFFPLGSSGDAAVQIKLAKAICATCPVRVTCREFAIETRQDYGVWGGKSEEERESIRRSRKRAERAARIVA